MYQTSLCYRLPGRSGKIIRAKGARHNEKSDLQILHLAKPDRTAALCLQRPNSWAFVCETGLEFIDKSSVRSDVMWFDFVHRFSNQSEKTYIIQPDLTSFDPVIRVFGWGSSLDQQPALEYMSDVSVSGSMEKD